MKILFASKNPAKIKYYAEELEKLDLEVLTLNDIDLELDIKEDGKSATENAIQKAKPYFEATNITTIGIDDTLYIEGLSDEEQPATHVRRINGKRLNDDEILKYYIDVVKNLGGKVEAKWVKGIAICSKEGTKTFEYSRSKFYFVEEKSSVMHEGYPLDSISIIPEFGKYLTELNPEERKIYKQNSSSKAILDFIKENIK